jgi:type IV pilus assembly protein PilY1
MDSATTGLQPALDTGVPNSLAGDFTAVDWDRNYLDEALYFGLIEGLDATAPSGRLNRLRFGLDTSGSAPRFVLNGTPISTLLDPGLPFQGAPVAYLDLAAGRQWVLAGTGRYLTSADNTGTYANRFYGLLEPLASTGGFSYAEVDETKLADTTDILVLKNEAVYDVSATPLTPAPLKSGAGSSLGDVATFTALVTAARSAGGWFNDLGKITIGTDALGNALLSTESRNYNGALAIGTGVGFVKYAPDQAICTPSGYSSLRFIDARTGTGSRGIFYEELAASSYSITGSIPVLEAETGVKQGSISKMTLVRTTDGAAVGVSDNYGGIQFEPVSFLPPLGYRQSWREIPIYQ